MWAKKPYDGDYDITSPYGERVHPITKEVKKHKGVDIALPENIVIRALFNGTLSEHIDKKGINGGFGRYAILEGATDQGTRVRAIYAHLNQVNKEGRVIEGNAIGLSGNTGSSTGPHLHLQLEALMLNKWEPIDPELSIDFEGVA